MNSHSEIDEVLRRLGEVEPPSGLQQRVERRLQNPRRGFAVSARYAMSACALAAGVFLAAVLFHPALRSTVFPHGAQQSLPAADTPRVIAPASGGFGAASTVHVPAEPIPVQPTPPSQGRGRSRSGRALLPSGAVAPLPRGAHHAPPAPAQPSNDAATPQ